MPLPDEEDSLKWHRTAHAATSKAARRLCGREMQCASPAWLPEVFRRIAQECQGFRSRGRLLKPLKRVVLTGADVPASELRNGVSDNQSILTIASGLGQPRRWVPVTRPAGRGHHPDHAGVCSPHAGTGPRRRQEVRTPEAGRSGGRASAGRLLRPRLTRVPVGKRDPRAPAGIGPAPVGPRPPGRMLGLVGKPVMKPLLITGFPDDIGPFLARRRNQLHIP
jgi:hypothetical protein